MEFLQKKLSHPTKLKPAEIKPVKTIQTIMPIRFQNLNFCRRGNTKKLKSSQLSPLIMCPMFLWNDLYRLCLNIQGFIEEKKSNQIRIKTNGIYQKSVKVKEELRRAVLLLFKNLQKNFWKTRGFFQTLRSESEFYPTDYEPFSIKTKIRQNAGFAGALFLPFMALMTTGMMGLFSLSMGVKNITKAQSYCIKSNLKGQKELGILLTKILKLNSKVQRLHKTRKAISASIVTATGLGQLHVASALKKKLEFVKQVQKILALRQKHLLAKSFYIKRKMPQDFKNHLKNMKTFRVRDKTFYKKALALKKQKIGDQAYVYKPVQDFTKHQKTSLEWKIQAFSPLNDKLKWLLPAKARTFSSHTCTASLQQKGETWISLLYH